MEFQEIVSQLKKEEQLEEEEAEEDEDHSEDLTTRAFLR